VCVCCCLIATHGPRSHTSITFFHVSTPVPEMLPCLHGKQSLSRVHLSHHVFSLPVLPHLPHHFEAPPTCPICSPVEGRILQQPRLLQLAELDWRYSHPPCSRQLVTRATGVCSDGAGQLPCHSCCCCCCCCCGCCSCTCISPTPAASSEGARRGQRYQLVVNPLG
jgi:hypothetical protein